MFISVFKYYRVDHYFIFIFLYLFFNIIFQGSCIRKWGRKKNAEQKDKRGKSHNVKSMQKGQEGATLCSPSLFWVKGTGRRSYLKLPELPEVT